MLLGFKFFLVHKALEKRSASLMFEKMFISYGEQRDDGNGQENARNSCDLLPGKDRKNNCDRMQVDAAADDTRICNLIVNDA